MNVQKRIQVEVDQQQMIILFIPMMIPETEQKTDAMTIQLQELTWAVITVLIVRSNNYKMKTIRLFTTLMIGIVFLFSTSSCFVYVDKDNGKHRGWYKNPNNPHHPQSTKPAKVGKSNGNGKGKGK